MRTIFFAIFSILTLAVSMHGQEDHPLLLNGKVFIQQARYDEAIKNFDLYIDKYPDNHEGYYNRGYCKLILQEYNGAIEDLTKAYKRDVNFWPTHEKLALTYMKLGNYNEAIDWFNRAVVSNESKAQLFNGRGMAYYYMDNYKKAFVDFNKAVELDSTFAMAYNNRGSARYNNQNIADASEADLILAAKDFSKSIKLKSDNAMALKNRGIVNLYLGNYQSSLDDLKKSLELDAEEGTTYFNIGKVLFELSDIESSIEYFSKSLTYIDFLPEIYLSRGKALLKLQKYSSARRDFFRAMEVDKNARGESYFYIATSYAAQKNDIKMIQFLRLARRYHFFNNSSGFRTLRNAPEFDVYRDDKKFKKFKNNLAKKQT